jgi:hypothetical protein
MNSGPTNIDKQWISDEPEISASKSEIFTTVNLIWQMNPHGLIEIDWINFLFSEFNINHIYDPNLEVVLDNSIVITEGYSVGETSVREYISSFKRRGYCVGVLHLSDEWFTAPVDFYSSAAFVLRNFYRPDVAHLKNVVFVPVGYKQGLHQYSTQRSISDRQYYWSFAGALGGKVSRRSMIKHAKNIPSGVAYISKSYNNSQDLSFKGYVELICDTVFVLSPAGNRCAETSRFYEALELGAIPVVEDVSKLNILKQILKEVLVPAKAKKHRAWTLRYWKDVLSLLFERSYWTQVYGLDFPCPKCSDWRQLRATLEAVDIETTSQKVQFFWQEYKKNLKDEIRSLILHHFAHSAEF